MEVIKVPLVFSWVGEHAVRFDKRVIGQVLENLAVELEFGTGITPHYQGKVAQLVVKFFAKLQERMPEFDRQSLPSFTVNIAEDLVGIGLGASAAVFVALATFVTRVNKGIDYTVVRDLLADLEADVHVHCSGLDQYLVCQQTGIYRFQNGEGLRLAGGFPFPFLLINTGRVETTAQLTKHVQAHWEVNRSRVFMIMRKIGNLAYKFWEAVQREDYSYLRSVMDRNQDRLYELGVVSDSVQEFVKRLRTFSLAAKVSGVGGVEEGSGIVVVTYQSQQDYSNIRSLMDQFDFKIIYRAQEQGDFYI